MHIPSYNFSINESYYKKKDTILMKISFNNLLQIFSSMKERSILLNFIRYNEDFGIEII